MIFAPLLLVSALRVRVSVVAIFGIELVPTILLYYQIVALVCAKFSCECFLFPLLRYNVRILSRKWGGVMHIFTLKYYLCIRKKLALLERG